MFFIVYTMNGEETYEGPFFKKADADAAYAFYQQCEGCSHAELLRIATKSLMKFSREPIAQIEVHFTLELPRELAPTLTLEEDVPPAQDSTTPNYPHALNFPADDNYPQDKQQAGQGKDDTSLTMVWVTRDAYASQSTTGGANQ